MGFRPYEEAFVVLAYARPEVKSVFDLHEDCELRMLAPEAPPLTSK